LRERGRGSSVALLLGWGTGGVRRRERAGGDCTKGVSEGWLAQMWAPRAKDKRYFQCDFYYVVSWISFSHPIDI
jgi:hypothetical protein